MMRRTLLRLWILLPQYGMTGYFISFTVTHIINFLLSLRLLLKITDEHIPFYVPALSFATVMVAVWGAGFFPGPAARSTAYLMLLGSLLCLFRITGREDILWLRGLLRKK